MCPSWTKLFSAVLLCLAFSFRSVHGRGSATGGGKRPASSPTAKPTARRPYAANNTYCMSLQVVASDASCSKCLQRGCDYCYSTRLLRKPLCFDGNIANLTMSKHGGCSSDDLYYAYYYTANADLVCSGRKEGCDVGCIIGAAFGVPLFCFICVCIGYYYYRRRGKSRLAVDDSSTAQAQSSFQPQQPYPMQPHMHPQQYPMQPQMVQQHYPMQPQMMQPQMMQPQMMQPQMMQPQLMQPQMVQPQMVQYQHYPGAHQQMQQQMQMQQGGYPQGSLPYGQMQMQPSAVEMTHVQHQHQHQHLEPYDPTHPPIVKATVISGPH